MAVWASANSCEMALSEIGLDMAHIVAASPTISEAESRYASSVKTNAYYSQNNHSACYNGIVPLISFPQRLSDLAESLPDRPAVVCNGRSISRADLERAGNRLARDLADRGVGYGDFVTVALPNSIDWFITYVAVWKLGATPQPVSAKLPPRELAAIVELASPKVVVGVEPDSDMAALLPDGVHCLPKGYEPSDEYSDESLPDATSPAWKAHLGRFDWKAKTHCLGRPSDRGHRC